MWPGAGTLRLWLPEGLEVGGSRREHSTVWLVLLHVFVYLYIHSAYFCFNNTVINVSVHWTCLYTLLENKTKKNVYAYTSISYTYTNIVHTFTCTRIHMRKGTYIHVSDFNISGESQKTPSPSPSHSQAADPAEFAPARRPGDVGCAAVSRSCVVLP